MIEPLPTPPSRGEQDRQVFVMTTDAFLAALPAWTAQVNQTADDIEQAKSDVLAAVEDASGQAQAATAMAGAASEQADRAEAASGYRVSIARKTWTELEAIAGTADQTAAVFNDAGTHDDPVTSDEDVDNEGIYRYSIADAGWERLADLSAVEPPPPAFSALTGDPDDNSALSTALDAKLAKSGGTMTGLLTLAAELSLVLGSGTPSSPVAGQLWYESGIFQCRTAANTQNLIMSSSPQWMTNKTLVMPLLQGIAVEDVYEITDAAGFAVDPANGGIQRVTLGANRTPDLTAITAGKWVALDVDDGSGFSLTLTSGSPVLMNYGGTFPGLKSSGWTRLLFSHNGDQLQYWVVGSAP